MAITLERIHFSQSQFLVLKLNRNIATLLFPARCLGCREELGAAEVRKLLNSNPPKSNGFDFEQSFGTHWCRDCWNKLNDNSNRCRKCSATVFKQNPLNDRCQLCNGFDLRFESSISVGNYRGLLQDLVIRMKNQQDEQLAIQIGRLLGYQVLQSGFHDELNLVVPVPTHWWRRAKRGFHAADVVSQSVADCSNVPYSGHLLRCLRSTKKQGTLSTTGRFKNVRNAFGLAPRTSISGLTILLVDDVMTSGATTSEVARLLLRAGANKVFVGVIARGAGVS